jgi:hypothetical protein
LIPHENGKIGVRALRQNLPDFVVAMQDRPHEPVLWRSRRTLVAG